MAKLRKIMKKDFSKIVREMDRIYMEKRDGDAPMVLPVSIVRRLTSEIMDCWDELGIKFKI